MSFLLQAILGFFSFFVPKRKNLIVLGSTDGRLFNGNPKAFYTWLNQHQPGIRAVWSTRNPEIYEFLKQRGMPVVRPLSFKGFFILLRARYSVIEKSSLDVSYTRSITGRFDYVQTNHGTPLKKVGDDAFQIIKNPFLDNLARKFKLYSKLRYKYVVSKSKVESRTLLSAFGNKNIIVTGYPRNDLFFDEKLRFFDYKKSLNLDSYKKILLYAPTYRDNYPEVKPFSEKIRDLDRYLRDNHFILLVKKHPLEKALVLPGGLTHIRDISGQVDDLNELLPHIDILITDYSSSFFDFVLTGKPVIYYPYDYEEYLKKCRGMYYDYFKELPGPFARSESELLRLIKNSDIWQKNSEYLKKYQAFAGKFNAFNDGNSSERLFKVLFSELYK